MIKVFIVRPFGERSILKKDTATGNINTIKYNFDAVEAELIRPAMKALNLWGGTTGEVFEAGDIREDMFSELLLADIVIADISIYNANVFYELGIRHALRDKRTILIKSRGFDETPFDLIGLRYIAYEKENPSAALQTLIKSIDETIKADRKDSLVFNILPALQTQDPEKYLALPEDFIEEVTIAEQARLAGKLSLLAYETESFTWQFPALRLIGEALFKLNAFGTAKLVWEKIRNYKSGDIQANDRLATIYQRLAEMEMKRNPDEANAFLVKSDLAIGALINNRMLGSYEVAEAYALKGRNAKTRWINSWSESPENERGAKALQSINLESSFNSYEKGFCEDLNHFYSGINALGLLITTISLAENNPGIWELAFDSKELADQKLIELKNKSNQLSVTVKYSIASAKNKLDLRGASDVWLNITEADFMCLTAVVPARVASIYTKVLQDAPGLNMDATTRQLKLYESLAVKSENVKAALSAMPPSNASKKPVTYFLLFTGHMIDKPDRKQPRFPASKEVEVRKAIKDKLVLEKNKMEEGSVLCGVAGAACGGDILFHEICAELDIPTQMFLAIPREKFLVESVAFAGIDWIERFDKLYEKLPHPVLSDQKELPKWLQKKPRYDIWSRNNLWELNYSLINGGMNMTLLALWDGKAADGPGGTEDMVNLAKKNGSKTVIIDI
ncbi:MAG: tetratricopeptide repeat-containing protein [Ginsengibacter sp.]